MGSISTDDGKTGRPRITKLLTYEIVIKSVS